MNNHQPGLELDSLISRQWMGWHLSDETHWSGPPANRFSYKLWLDADNRNVGYDTTSNSGFSPSTNAAHASEIRRKAESWNLHTFNHPNPMTISCEIRVGDRTYLGWCKYQEVKNNQARAEALATSRAIAAVIEASKGT